MIGGLNLYTNDECVLMSDEPQNHCLTNAGHAFVKAVSRYEWV